MFGDNEVAHRVDDDGQMLHVVEGSPWVTIQGEGPFAGRAAIFIRLHGCPLRCTFCDTDFSGDFDPMWKIDDLVQEVVRLSGKEKLLVVITGGEPLRQNIRPLCRKLWLEGFDVQIETAGMYWRDNISIYADIVCSPKTPTIHPDIARNAIAFKYVISAGNEFDGFVPIAATQPGAPKRRLAAPREGAPVYLSPMDEYDVAKNAANMRKVAELAIKYNAIAGIQLHKLLEVE